MSGTDIRVADLPDLGSITDTTIFVADKAGATGKFSALTVKNYAYAGSLPEAPSTNTPYGRQNGAWVAVPATAPSNGVLYGQLNGSWSPAVPPSPSTGLAYGRLNSSWVEVLPITGGALSGSLNVAGNIGSGGAVLANAFQLSSANGYEWIHYVAANGDHIQQHRPGWYDTWISSTGDRHWIGAAGVLMAMDTTGALKTAAGVFGMLDGSLGMYPGGAGRVIQFSPSWYWDWNTSNGTVNWFAGGAGLFWSMRTTDLMCFNNLGVVGGRGAYYNAGPAVRENITPAAIGLAEVLRIEPITFDTEEGERDVGFAAENVRSALPQAVAEREAPAGGKMLGVASEIIVAALVNAIKELTARIEELEGSAP